MQHYIVYDGRAALLTTDDACIMEVLGDFESDELAIQEAENAWGEYDYCLYAYDFVALTSQLKNERLVTQSVPS